MKFANDLSDANGDVGSAMEPLALASLDKRIPTLRNGRITVSRSDGKTKSKTPHFLHPGISSVNDPRHSRHASRLNRTNQEPAATTPATIEWLVKNQTCF